MDVSVRELRNHTARVIAAVESGEHVVLTVHGRPVADIRPHETRSESRPMNVVVDELNALAELARELGLTPRPEDYELDWTTDDFARRVAAGDLPPG